MVDVNDNAKPQPSVDAYDHAVRKHPRLWLAIVASVLVLGGGQVVKGHYKTCIVFWLIAVLGTAGILAAVIVLRPTANTYELTAIVWKAMYAVLWIVGLLDTAFRP